MRRTWCSSRGSGPGGAGSRGAEGLGEVAVLLFAGGVVGVVAAARAIPPGPGGLQGGRVDVQDGGVGQPVLGDDRGGGQVLDPDRAQAFRGGSELVGPRCVIGAGLEGRAAEDAHPARPATSALLKLWLPRTHQRRARSPGSSSAGRWAQAVP